MISIYVRNKDICPASYYRITQYLEDIKDSKFNNIASDKMFCINQQLNRRKMLYQVWRMIYFIHMTIRGISFELRDIVIKPKTIVVSRSIFPHKSIFLGRFLLTRILKKADTIIWDFDDDIFLNGEISNGEKDILERHSTKIIVTHDYLKSLLPSECQKKTVTLPTTDGDFDKYINRDFEHERLNELVKKINLIWVGQATNLRYFDEIINELDTCAMKMLEKKGRTLQLTIVCNQPLNIKTKNLKIINKLWSKQVALEELCKAHIGIMPLINEKYVLGKGGFKLIQYMSASLPVVGSNVGYNKEIIDNNIGFLVNRKQWGDAIIRLVESDEYWIERSNNSREKWENKYNYKQQKLAWQKFINEG